MYGKIYRLNYGDLTYIGSTICPSLSQRLRGHRHEFNHWVKTGRGYNSNFELFKQGSPTITLIEEVECESRAELRARQGQYQLKIKSVNINQAGGNPNSYADWRLAHLEQRQTYIAQWNAENPDKLKTYNASYYKNNIVRIKQSSQQAYYKKKRLLRLNAFIVKHLQLI
jgi:hypothetical protein